MANDTVRVTVRQTSPVTVKLLPRTPIVVKASPSLAPGLRFIVDATPEQIDAAPDGTVFLTTAT